MHLTNYAINKQNEDFVRSEAADKVGRSFEVFVSTINLVLYFLNSVEVFVS